MIDIVKLAGKVNEMMADEGAESNEQCAALITALALVLATYKAPHVSTALLTERCVDHLRRAMRITHQAREALQPHG